MGQTSVLPAMVHACALSCGEAEESEASNCCCSSAPGFSKHYAQQCIVLK